MLVAAAFAFPNVAFSPAGAGAAVGAGAVVAEAAAACFLRAANLPRPGMVSSTTTVSFVYCLSACAIVSAV